MAVGQEPAGALGNVITQEDDDQPKSRSHAETQSPAQVRPEEARVEQDDARERAGRGPQPERAVDRQVGPAADAARESTRRWPS